MRVGARWDNGAYFCLAACSFFSNIAPDIHGGYDLRQSLDFCCTACDCGAASSRALGSIVRRSRVAATGSQQRDNQRAKDADAAFLMQQRCVSAGMGFAAESLSGRLVA